MDLDRMVDPSAGSDVSQRRGSASSAHSAARPAAQIQTVSELIDQSTEAHGITWRHRADADWLESIEPDQWTQPQRAGWTCVKQHAARSIWRADLAGRTCYVKYFFAQGWRARVRGWFQRPPGLREWLALTEAQARGLPTPRPLAFTSKLSLMMDDSSRRPASALVFEAIEPARPLNRAWIDITRSETRSETRSVHARQRSELIESVAQTLADAHHRGFEHVDLHPENLLVRDTFASSFAETDAGAADDQEFAPAAEVSTVVFVDLLGARFGPPLPQTAWVRNLCQLNQWFRRQASRSERLRFLKRYLRWQREARKADGSDTKLPALRALLPIIDRRATLHARALHQQRDRRLARRGKYFSRVKLRDNWSATISLLQKRPLAYAALSEPLGRAWWKQALKHPTELMAAAQVAKASHSAQVGVAHLSLPSGAVSSVHLKRPIPRNRVRALRQWLFGSRAGRAFRMGHQLLHRDIPTARPLALLERRALGLVTDSLLIVESVPNSVDLERYLRSALTELPPRRQLRTRRRLAERLGLRLRELNAAGIRHRDCKASNLLVAPVPGDAGLSKAAAVPRLNAQPIDLLWIDLDGMRRSRVVRGEDLCRALARLWRSVVEIEGVGRTDALRCLRAIARGSQQQRAGLSVREMWAGATRANEQSADRVERRRQWKLKHYGRI